MNHSNDNVDEEFLHSLHNKVLEVNRAFLCHNGKINPKHHYPFLRGKGILNLEICAEIDHNVGPTAKANRFVDELQRNGGSSALLCFLESLRRDGTQIFILKRLNETLEELRHNPPPSIALCHNNNPNYPHRTREVEESSSSVSDTQSIPPCDGPTVYLRRNGGPLLLPSFESLANCTPSVGRDIDAETTLTPHNTELEEH